MTIALLALAAVLLDWLLGEPRRFHPLVGFGRLTMLVERGFYGGVGATSRNRRWRGILAVLLLLLPLTAVAKILTALPDVGVLCSLLMLYFAIGHKSLHDHARPIAVALRDNNDDEARRLAAQMVSRDSAALDAPGAATESVLENGNDGVFGALFWFIVAGGAGAVLYRLANTLDAMWGYRNDRYRHFGWAAARFDDLLNFIPARLTALTYALLGNTSQALSCWRTQTSAWDSPNAGPVMAAGAGALGISIGGPARYLGEWHQRPILGIGKAPSIADIERALTLVRRGVWLWLGLLFITGGTTYA
ncbi:MAG: cobalamin biosynthesis protein [Gammaproteobacteria bacterium]|nr:MAG: cobalamin biosynthesis protein [Gammaproteobacteria bacterium]